MKAVEQASRNGNSVVSGIHEVIVLLALFGAYAVAGDAML